jgi:hypothetical protein
MQYNKHNFKSKQVLTSQMMNEIDQGIADLVEHANANDGKLNLTIGTVTSGSTAAATISDGKLNLTLPKGEKGDTGPKGDAGAKGEKGDTGATPNLIIGSVTSGETPNAIIAGTAETPMLNLVLPKGAKGEKGDTGATPNLIIGSVTTGDTANAIITGTVEAPVLNLTLPKGAKGDTGPKGADGVQGQAGPKGDPGSTPNLTIGTVTTGTDAAATITGTAEAPVLNLTLPKGEKGDKGDPGSSGSGGSSTGGDATDLTIGTVTSGTTASAEIVGGKLNLVLPKGDTGAKGDAGPKGDVGEGFTENAKHLILALFESAAYNNVAMKTSLDALRTEWGGSAQDAPVQSVSLSSSTLILSEGESQTLTATVLPANATSSVVWTVSPAGFATVVNGKVTAENVGNCTVTAIAGGKSASCKVTVEAADTSQLIYTLPAEASASAAESKCVDTGLKLLEHASTETPIYTILFEAKVADTADVSNWPTLVNCQTETGDFNNMPGFNGSVNPSAGTIEFAYYKFSYSDVRLCDTLAHAKTKTRYAIQMNGKQYRVGSTHCALSEWKTTGDLVADVPETLIFGAAYTATGTHTRFLDCTIYQCKVYKGLLSDSKVQKFIEET